MRSALWLALVLVAACGDDDAPPQQVQNRPAAQAAAKKKEEDKNKLKPRVHVEDRVVCPIPDKPTGPACEPIGAGSGAGGTNALADCEPGRYCLAVGNGFSCEPCQERDIIRHEFKDRDFVAEQARDPFQSYVIVNPNIGTLGNGARPEPHQTCKRADQFQASNYSYQDLKLVGIVAQGTTRKVLMMDTANVGHIIKRGDCVGKEKAVVKDIGPAYVTFVVEEDPDLRRPSQETSVQLHPGGLEAEPPPQSMPNPDQTGAPVVKPATPSTNVPVVVPGGSPAPKK